jgi:hypothetical protein
MAYPAPSGSFLHATLYSSLLLQVSRELFPAQSFLDLSPLSLNLSARPPRRHHFVLRLLQGHPARADLARGYEGLVAKDPESPYVGGRTLKWLKVKQPKYREGERGWEPKK